VRCILCEVDFQKRWPLAYPYIWKKKVPISYDHPFWVLCFFLPISIFSLCSFRPRVMKQRWATVCTNGASGIKRTILLNKVFSSDNASRIHRFEPEYTRQCWLLRTSVVHQQSDVDNFLGHSYSSHTQFIERGATHNFTCCSCSIKRVRPQRTKIFLHPDHTQLHTIQ
jgi:hypothetical protein